LKTQTKVSLVVPCYNKVKWIGEMLQSVSDQIWDNIEVILVNDGSTDGTREIIAEWEPRLKARGYETIIVDQENKGCGAAIRNGLMRVTGEYVVMPDCDDRLHSEYVSVMATWLDRHPGAEWVACNYDNMAFDHESMPGLKKNVKTIDGYYQYSILESRLTNRLRFAVAFNMWRTSFLCGSIDFNKFITDLCNIQEPQIWYAVAPKAKSIWYFRKKLLFYNNDESRYNTFKNNEKSEYYPHKRNVELQIKLILNTIKNYKYSKSDFELAELSCIRLGIDALRKYPESAEYVKQKAVEYSKKLFEYEFLNPSMLSGRQITVNNLDLFHRAFSNVIIGYKNIETIERKPGGRIIGYAALGRAAKILLTEVFDTTLSPDTLWDVAANANSEFSGMKVTKPDFASLTGNDIVLVFLKDPQIAETVSYQLESTDTKGNIYYYYDILDYVARLMFPKISAETVNYHRGD
jgi:glycosyltransferase involved in cell wall biosynthesis